MEEINTYKPFHYAFRNSCAIIRKVLRILISGQNKGLFCFILLWNLRYLWLGSGVSFLFPSQCQFQIIPSIGSCQSFSITLIFMIIFDGHFFPFSENFSSFSKVCSSWPQIIFFYPTPIILLFLMISPWGRLFVYLGIRVPPGAFLSLLFLIK